MIVLHYYYKEKNYSKRECELIDRDWARLNLKMSKNQEKISDNLTSLCAPFNSGGKNFKDFVDSSKFKKVTLANLLFPVELLKDVERQGKRREIRTEKLDFREIMDQIKLIF